MIDESKFEENPKAMLNTLESIKVELENAYSRVRFTAEFAAYMAKPLWFLLDWLGDYWHLVM